MSNLKQLLGFPFREREWFMKMIIGSVISIVPIVNFLSLGYFIRCIQNSWRGYQSMPDWDNWGELFRNGCMVFVILLAYLVLPISLGFLMLALPVVGTVFASLIIFIMSIIIPMAIANYAVHMNIRDAFAFTEIFYRSGRVLSVYLAGYLAVTLGLILGSVLLVGIPILGFVGGLLMFYCGVVFFNFMGILYREAN